MKFDIKPKKLVDQRSRVILTIETDINDGDYIKKTTDMSETEFDYISNELKELIEIMKNPSDNSINDHHDARRHRLIAWIMDKKADLWSIEPEVTDKLRSKFPDINPDADDFEGYPPECMIDCLPCDYDIDDEYMYGHSIENISAVYIDKDGNHFDVILK